MSILSRKEGLILCLGDIVFLFLALWVTLLLRYGRELDQGVFYAHLSAFSVLIIVWLVVFFVAGLYEKHTLLFQRRLPGILLKAGIANALIAVIFFYFIPYFGITPKVNLFIYLITASLLVLFWRMYGYRLFYASKKQNAVIIGSGEELAELAREVNENERYHIRFTTVVDADVVDPAEFKKFIAEHIEREQVGLIALDLRNEKLEPVLPYLADMLFQNVQFVDIYRLYEDIFDRIPLSLITYDWFLEHISAYSSVGYDALKRLMDVVLSLTLGLVSLTLYPFIIMAIKFDDGGRVFIFQERVGTRGKLIRTMKFRTMAVDDAGVAHAAAKNHPTRVGPFLRRSRLDELPQLWNVLVGEMSLIGPRPELPSLVSVYEREVPYYHIRHLIKPGLSGWAQLYHEKHPHHEADVRETRVKLSYDLYYIKNRSFFLDLKIALKTLKTLLSRSGL